jgi:hypothetical protein
MIQTNTGVMTTPHLMKLWWCKWHFNISHLWKLLKWNGILYYIKINNPSCCNSHSISIFHDWILESINFDKLASIKIFKLSLEVFTISTHIELALGCVGGSMHVYDLYIGCYSCLWRLPNLFLLCGGCSFCLIMLLNLLFYVANCMWCSRNNFKVTMSNMKLVKNFCTPFHMKICTHKTHLGVELLCSCILTS